jgi:hypothetical protein
LHAMDTSSAGRASSADVLVAAATRPLLPYQRSNGSTLTSPLSFCRGIVLVQFSYSQMARDHLKWRARLIHNGKMPIRDFYLGSWLTRSDSPY